MAADTSNSILSIFNHIVQQHGSDLSEPLAQIINGSDHLKGRVRSSTDGIFPIFSPQSAGTSDCPKIAIKLSLDSQVSYQSMGVRSQGDIAMTFFVDRYSPMPPKHLEY